MGEKPFEIVYLCDNIYFAETAAKWIFDEFIDGIKDRTYEEVVASWKNCNRDKLPIRLVAVIDGRCAGAISIVENDLRCREYTPWLASLYVDEKLRKNGIGRALIERVKEIARGMGYKEIYLRTEHASGYYRKLGWEYVETTNDDFNLVPDVFKWKLV